MVQSTPRSSVRSTQRAGVGCAVWLAFALAACGTFGPPDGQGDAGADGSVSGTLAIAPAALEPAHQGRYYAQQLQASGGVAPYRWRADAGAELAWLGIDADTGLLSGTPDRVVEEGGVEVVVVDSAVPAAAARAAFLLPVLACEEGDTRERPLTGVSGCDLAEDLCLGGSWVQQSVSASTRVAWCGPLCTACNSPNVNACGNAGQQCVCGDLGACPGSASTCCGSGASSSCANLSASPDDCGQCGHSCDGGTRLNVERTCGGGACHFPCQPGYTDCSPGADGGWFESDPLDGCETHTGGDPSNCGACGHVCGSRPYTTTGCTGGACDFACLAGYTNCSGGGAGSAQGADGDGCETFTDGDLLNCGGCGLACPARANVVASCSAANCQYACAAGFRNCNGGSPTTASNEADGDGCETDANNDVYNCGACGHDCTVGMSATNVAASCVAGSCQYSCTAGHLACSGSTSISAYGGCPIDGEGDVTNCGSCGNSCPPRSSAPRTCVGGSCTYICSTGYRNCTGGGSGSSQSGVGDPDGCETNLVVDRTNCGACGHVCQQPVDGAESCTPGGCVGSCGQGLTLCGSVAGEGGICTNPSTDAANCGSCGYVCPNATDRCVAGDCNYDCGDGTTFCKSTQTCATNAGGFFVCTN